MRDRDKPTKRRAHWLKGNLANQSPQCCIWVDTETKPTPLDDGSEAHYLDFGMAAYARRAANGRWTRPEWITFTERAEFWDWVSTKTRPKVRTYIFAHNGAFDLPVLGAFTELPDRGWHIHRAVCDAPPMDITWRNENRSIRFIDTLNIWRMPLSELGKSVGLRKLRMPDHKASEARHLAYCRRDVKVIMRAMIKWLDFLKSNDLGGFQPTLASQALGTYRHRFMHYQIGIHNNHDAMHLERDSYVGGRTECFKLGRYEGEFYYIDVNSMYPSVMRGNLYPCRLSSWTDKAKLRHLERWRSEYCVIANVTLTTSMADYPLVHDGKLVFPVGTFNVSLAGPELYRALDAGHIKEVHQAAIYHPAELFTGYVDYVYNSRLKAKADGNAVDSHSFKILANSLYGKFGQRGRRYENIGTCAPNLIAIEDEWNDETHEFTTRRYFGGVVQEYKSEGESFNSFPAISSYVSSYARVVLADAITAAGRQNCYYCDTDSLVVNRCGWEKITHLIDQDRLGYWGLDRILDSIELRGPKDYTFDGDTKVKGVRKNAVWLSDDTVSQDQFVGFRGLVRHGSLDAPIVKRITKKMRRVYTKGKPAANGEVSPLEIG